MYGKWFIENLAALLNETTIQERPTLCLTDSSMSDNYSQPDLGLKNFFEICIEQLLESHQKTLCNSPDTTAILKHHHSWDQERVLTVS